MRRNFKGEHAPCPGYFFLRHECCLLNAEHCTPLLIQQKVDGSQYFNRSWQQFKAGFGNKTGNYWLGNDLLHQLTKYGQYKLRCDLHALVDGQCGTGLTTDGQYKLRCDLQALVEGQCGTGLTTDGQYKLRCDLQALVEGHWYWTDHGRSVQAEV